MKTKAAWIKRALLLAMAGLLAGCAVSGRAIVEQYKEVNETRFEGAVAVVLQEREVASVDDQGEGIVVEGFRRIKLLRQAALDCKDADNPNCRLTRQICYQETWDKVTSIEARTITPDGTVAEV